MKCVKEHSVAASNANAEKDLVLVGLKFSVLTRTVTASAAEVCFQELY